MKKKAGECVRNCENEIEENNRIQMKLMKERAYLYKRKESDKEQMSILDVAIVEIANKISDMEAQITKYKSDLEELQAKVRKNELKSDRCRKVGWATCWLGFINIATCVNAKKENDKYIESAIRLRQYIEENAEYINDLRERYEEQKEEQRKKKESSANLANKVTALNGNISFITNQINELRTEQSIWMRILFFCQCIEKEISCKKDILIAIMENIVILTNLISSLSFAKSTDKYIAGCRCRGNSLCFGQTLNQNEYLLSENRRFVAVMQWDNNFVVYTSERPIWDSRTYGAQGQGSIKFEADGMIVLNGTNMHWNTKRNGADVLIMQNDGNLVAYTKDNKPVWASDTYIYANTSTTCFKKLE
ncbi:MAG: hypothetical protein ACI4HI_18760 [Lachnospiraceae bacterium]